MKIGIWALAAMGMMSVPAAAQPAETLRSMAQEAVRDPAVPAMGVLLIRDGHIAEQAVAGVRARGSRAAATTGDLWHIGSNAKAMTATMIARLVERGVLSWTMPLSAMLPDVAMRPEFRDVTLPDLLSHRAGLRDLDDTRDAALLARAFADTRPLPMQRREFAALVLNEAPIGPARGESVYSNSGYVLAAAIAERATGMPFETLMQREIFAPLGMKVAYAPARAGQLLGHLGGKPLTGLKADNPPLVAPAGAVKLTLGDWAAFAIDQMAGEHGRGRLLTADSYRYLHSVQGGTNAALGWGVRSDWPKDVPIRMLTHAGSNGYWYALVALAPDQQSGVLIAANAAEGDVPQVETALMIKLMRGLVAERR